MTFKEITLRVEFHEKSVGSRVLQEGGGKWTNGSDKMFRAIEKLM
jgi:hypothetical protein